MGQEHAKQGTLSLLLLFLASSWTYNTPFLLYRQGTRVPSDLNAMVKAMQGHIGKTMPGQL